LGCGRDDCYFIASCYHPPKPKYGVDDFVAQLSSTIEDIIDREVNPVFLITGDFNLLRTEFLEEKFGFDQLVQNSIHGNILDKVFTNRPDLFQTTVHHSLLKTKYLAVTVSCGCYGAAGQRVSKRKKHVCTTFG